VNVFYLLERIFENSNNKIPYQEFAEFERASIFLKKQFSGWFQSLMKKSVSESIKTSIKIEPVVDFPNSHAAFASLADKIELLIKERKQHRIKNICIDLKLIAVAMYYSKGWIEADIPRLLSKYNDVNFSLNLLIISPEHLKSLNIPKNIVDWCKSSEESIVFIQEFYKEYFIKYGTRLKLNLRTYQNIPHWHGWLLENEYLFLGRTNWTFNADKTPVLQVGQNLYRYFDKTTNGWEERIQLYQNWFTYYSEFASTEVTVI
jgi:hypothetical protein